MSVGDAAQRGDPDSVRQRASDLKTSTVGGDISTAVRNVLYSIGGQGTAAYCVDRLSDVLQRIIIPAQFLQDFDTAMGYALREYGEQMDEIRRRARMLLEQLEEAERAEARAQARLDEAQLQPNCGDEVRAQRRSLSDAQWEVQWLTNQLRGLDEERESLDAAKGRLIRENRDNLVTTKGLIPGLPRVSQRVRVTATLPDGKEVSVSAVELARLVAPGKIREVWDALTEEQRRVLIDDHPSLIGNLEGIPLRDRHTANVIVAEEHRAELKTKLALYEASDPVRLADEITLMKSEIRSIDAILGDNNKHHKGDNFGLYTVYDKSGLERTVAGTTLVGFHPMRDSFITYQGPLDPVTGDVPAWVKNVAVSVPGTTASLGTFTDILNCGKDISAQAGEKGAVFNWVGGPMPEKNLLRFPSQRGFADTSGPRLAGFVNSVRLSEGTSMVPVAHSYGAVVLGEAERLGLRADRVVYVAPAGLGHKTSGLQDFPNTKGVPHFSLQARNDNAVRATQGLPLGVFVHGSADPLGGPGITRLETGYITDGDPESGTIESANDTDFMGSHSEVLSKESTSMVNIGRVIRGVEATVYHPDTVIRNQVFYGTGVLVPEEWVSTIEPGKPFKK